MVAVRPKFESPPVIETAIGVQFANLIGYSTAHAGWFWKDYLDKLGKNWSRAFDAPRLEDQFERFGTEDLWKPQIELKVVSPSQSNRTQIIRFDDERMVQLQSTRLILNWRKHSAAYPTFNVLLPEFEILLHTFEAFTAEAQLGTLTYNQWEIVYVDQFRKGDMWESPRDWRGIFPGLSTTPLPDHLLLSADETMSGDWRFSLPENRGRMYLSLRQLRLAPAGEEVLNVTFVARGPVDSNQTWEKGLKLGHDILNDTFIGVTSNEAQERWKKKA